ncbi:MAG TPA: gas vesicle protein [Cyanobacteria bacterium UBA11049]|nr:gas vesicle protein [Cyanobacteria bacterium UBA11049]
MTTHTSFPASSNNRGLRDAQKVIPTSTQGSSLADILERVLDKGIVIAGDISVSVATTELLTIRIRLLICSVDKAKEIGVNWWETNPYLSGRPRDLADTDRELQAKIQSLEAEVRSLRALAEQSLPSPS